MLSRIQFSLISFNSLTNRNSLLDRVEGKITRNLIPEIAAGSADSEEV